MATHSSILAWRIPWVEEPGRLQSMGSQRVGHNWATELNWTECTRHLPQMHSLQVGSAFWLRTYLINQYVILRYCSSNLCKWNYLHGDLSFFKIQVNLFMAQDEPFGDKIITKCILWVRGLVPFWVLRHSFLLLTDCQGLYNIQLKTSSGVLFLPPSDAYVGSFLYLLYTLIKLNYTKALSDQASSLAPDWILLLQGPRIPASWIENAFTLGAHPGSFRTR